MAGEMAGPAPEERTSPRGRRNAQGIRVDPEVTPEPEPSRTVLSALVEHVPGVLTNVSGLFARRQFNIESLTVGPTTDPELARMTIVANEPEPGIEQVKRQLRKQVHTRSVREVEGATERELALIKVDGEDPAGVSAVAEMYGGEAVRADEAMVTVEVTGSEAEIDAAVAAFDQFGVQEVARTGTAALAGGTQSTS